MPTSLVSLQPRNVKKPEKLIKIVYNEEKISSYHLNDLRNFNEIFSKDLTYDNIESHKKSKASFLE